MGAEELLKRIVGINSVFPNERRLASFLEGYLKKNGFSVRRLQVENNRFNLMAEKGQGKRSILFYGHMDTVPIYGNWHTNPLKLTKKGDKLFGLGACDMKGGMAAAIEASKDSSGKKIKLLLAVDEENISRGAWVAVKKRRAWFRDVTLAISAEIGASKRFIGGDNVITLGRRGRTVIRVEVKGRAAHGAHVHRGISAISEGAKLIEYIEGMKLRKHSKLGPETLFVRRFEGASTSLSLPEDALFDIDVHYVPPTTMQEMKDKVVATIKAARAKGVIRRETKVKIYIKKRDTPYLQPYVTDHNRAGVKRVMGIMRKMSGKAPIINYGASVADENAVATILKAPIIVIGPRGGNMHHDNEWVSERSLNALERLFKEIIRAS